MSIMLGICVSYLLGSIPFGFLLAYAKGHGDIRQHGSGNIGATNVMRKGGKALGITTLLLDAGKGWLCIWLASHYGAPISPLWFGIVAMLGHMFPVWLQFKGGKGVATGAGIILAFSPMLAAVGGVVFLVFFSLFGYVSLASIIAILTIGLVGIALFTPVAAWPLMLMTILIIWCHRQNIERLAKGTEPKFRKQRP
jgi:glycerol-3-phosphate acyltransferase PlsY